MRHGKGLPMKTRYLLLTLLTTACLSLPLLAADATDDFSTRTENIPSDLTLLNMGELADVRFAPDPAMLYDGRAMTLYTTLSEAIAARQTVVDIRALGYTDTAELDALLSQMLNAAPLWNPVSDAVIYRVENGIIASVTLSYPVEWNGTTISTIEEGIAHALSGITDTMSDLEKKYAYIDASDFEAGHTYRFAVMAKDSYENTLVWAKVEFSIEKTATTYEISITTPVDGEVYPLDRLKARWTDVEDCDYFTYSLRDTTTNTLIIENQRVGRLYAYIEAENFEAGHTYKFAVMARESSGDVLAWAQSEFSISDSIPVTGVELDVTSYSLKVRQTYRLKVTVLPTTASNQDVTFKSSNTSIATVSTSGKVTAKSAGTVNITVTTDDGGYKAKCVFTITEENRPVTGISLDITSYSLEVGDTFSLTETVLPENATNQKVIWSSSNPSVAVVSSIGNVTAMSVGTTTITATTEDGGYTADCIVTVTNKTPIHGDVNGDGRIDYYDVTALYAAYVSDSFDLDTMDINKDGIVDYYDIARLYAYYCGYIFDL